MMKFVALAVVILALIGGGVYAFAIRDEGTNTEVTTSQTSESTSPEDSSEQAQAQPASTAGNFITYEEFNANKQDFNDKTVVYYFSAKWCPTCQALNKDINANLNSIPSDVVIVSIDYDSNIDLRRQYGVTVQHTLVVVDNDGNQLDKWTGGNTLDTILGRI